MRLKGEDNGDQGSNLRMRLRMKLTYFEDKFKDERRISIQFCVGEYALITVVGLFFLAFFS